jgi:hypothetical protein
MRAPGTTTLCWIATSAALAWAATSVALLLLHMARYGGILSGSDGPLAGSDQFLYMDFIRQSGSHLLIGEQFDLTIGHQVYLEPIYLLGGLLWRCGLSIAAAFWSLKLLAAPVLALGICAVVARSVVRPGERLVAVGLALFYMSPLVPVLRWSGAVTGVDAFRMILPAGESMPAWELWGYLHAAVAMGALAFALMGIVSLADGARSRRLIAGTAGCAGLAAWLHPWSGAIFILVTAAILLRAPSRRLLTALMAPLAAVAAPLAYLAILPHVDAGWQTLSRQNGASLAFVPVWMLVVVLLPLAAPAAWGWRAFAAGSLRTVLIAWPLAALAVYVVSPQFRYHALQGISIPLAVLAVAGWRELRLPRLGVLAALAAIIAGPAYEVSTLRDSLRAGISPYSFTPDDRHALAYLDQLRTPGGVLSRYYLGMTVPAYTGRRTWIGETTWTPSFAVRRAEAEAAFDGGLSAAQTLRFVRAVAPSYVLRDCGASRSLDQVLTQLPASIHRFGCAAVFVLPTAAARSAGSAAR